MDRDTFVRLASSHPLPVTLTASAGVRGVIAAAAVAAAALLGAACASGTTRPVAVGRVQPVPVLFVADRTGAPAAGATVFWTTSTPHGCESFGPATPVYDRAGQGTTDASGWARFPEYQEPPRGRRNAFHVVGPSRDKTLSSFAEEGLPKFVQLLPTARVELTLRCGQGPCGRVWVRGDIAHDGAHCVIHDRAAESGQLALAGLPRGDLELQFRVDEGKETEGLAVHHQPLVGDVAMTVDIATVGGPHRLAGRVLFADGAPTGGQHHATTVHLACSNGLSRHATPDPSTGAFELLALPPVACAITAHHGRNEGTWQATPLVVFPADARALTLTLAKVPPD